MPGQQPPAPSGSQQVIEEFRANGGRVGGMLEGAQLLLLTTAGRRTGKPRTNPVAWRRDEARYLIFGTNAGGPRHPGWYHNLLADPQVTIETGTQDGQVIPAAARAVAIRGAQRDRIYELQCTANPAFRDYQERTDRIIPVVALYPLDLAGDPERLRLLGEQLIAHHNSLRAGLGRARDLIEAALAGAPQAGDAGLPAADLVAQLRQRCLSSCYGLQLHHIREDGALPAIEQHFPHLAPVTARLRSEHREVAAALASLEELLGDGQRADPAYVRELRARLERVTSGLEEHFRREEHELLPALGTARQSQSTGGGGRDAWSSLE
jgi:deazaflavin-dependent oxidoreductase (nitroreductase family)